MDPYHRVVPSAPPRGGISSVWKAAAGRDTPRADAGREYEPRASGGEEANACIDGAASAGARRLTVNDSHGAMHNIYADDLDPRADLVVGTAKPWSMGQGIDGGYDTCFFVGYHGRAGHPKAVLDHTYASRAISTPPEQEIGRRNDAQPVSRRLLRRTVSSSPATTRPAAKGARSCPTS